MRLTKKQLETAVTNGAQVAASYGQSHTSAVTRVIPMAAFGKERPRVTRNGTYMPPAYEAKRNTLRMMFGPVPGGLVSLSVTAVRAMPRSWSKKKRTEMCGRYAKPKPDIDNIVGGILDSLFEDDDRVVALDDCKKVWGEKHELRITIAPVDSGG